MIEINVDSLLLNRKDVETIAERRYWRKSPAKWFWTVFGIAVVVAAVITWAVQEQLQLKYLCLAPLVPVIIWWMVLVRQEAKHRKEFVAAWIARYGDFPGGHGGHDVVSEG
jgi:Flp pilus assembly protein TadB